MRRTLWLAVLVVFVLCGFCFAGDMVAKEAVNYFNAGVKAQKGAIFVDADINYTKALLMDPNNMEFQKNILNNRGIMFAQLGDSEKAEAAFKAVLSIDPQNRAAKLNLGLINEKRLSRCEALEYWAKIYNFDKQKPRDFIISGDLSDQDTGSTKK